jgi:DNA primase
MQKRNVTTPEQKAVGRRDMGYLVKEISDPDVRHFYREELSHRFQKILDVQAKGYNSSDQVQRQGRFLSKNLLKLNSLKTEYSSVSRVSPNKNLLGHKILLATLINHPTLVEDTAESLMLLSDEAGKYDELRQAILSHMAENPPPLAVELQEMLRKQGFASMLEEVLTPQIYAVAPFARESATREEALEGWKEVWQRTIAKRHLIAETTRTASAVRDQFDEETWERFKFLKNQIVSKKDDKKGV